MYLYSKCGLDELLLENEGQNGDILDTILFNRDCRYNTIYASISLTGRCLLSITRCFVENGELVKYRQDLGEITEEDTRIEIPYDMLNDYEYTAFQLHFECISDVELEIHTIGLISKVYELNKGASDQLSSTAERDVNGNFLNKQEYDKQVAFAFQTERFAFTEILNIVDKPFFLTDTVNFNQNELMCASIVTNYMNGMGQILEITLQNMSR